MMKTFLLIGAIALTTLHTKAQTTILSEQFEAAVNNTLSNSWTTYAYGGTNVLWTALAGSPTTAAMGFSGKVIYSYGSNVNNMLFSPQINLTAGNTYTLTFQIASYQNAPEDDPNMHYAVYVKQPSGPFLGTEPKLLEETISTPGVAYTKTIDLSAYAGQNIKLCFRHFKETPSSLKTLALFDNVTLTQNSALGTSEVNNKDQVGIYPNPATESLTVKSKSDVISTEVYDLSGRKLDNQQGKNVNVRNLQPGNYILNVNTKEGKTSTKFIKK